MCVVITSTPVIRYEYALDISSRVFSVRFGSCSSEVGVMFCCMCMWHCCMACCALFRFWIASGFVVACKCAICSISCGCVSGFMGGCGAFVSYIYQGGVSVSCCVDMVTGMFVSILYFGGACAGVGVWSGGCSPSVVMSAYMSSWSESM